MTKRRRIIPLTRRQFLTGASGFTLALPVLSSLFVEKAHGADPAFVRRPRLYWITTNHGGALEPAFFPSASPATHTHTLFSDHSVSAGALRAASRDSATTSLSPILRAPNHLLSERRISQINVLRGIDIPFGLGHHTGGHLGNYARNEGLSGAAFEAQSEPRPTIDQLLAWSPSFYADDPAARERALVMGTRDISFGFSNPSRTSGQVQSIRGATSSLELFHRMFGPTGAEPTTRTPVVDRVLESYKRLRNGERRLSAADRQRLDDHMDRIAELQRKLNAAFPASCGAVVAPTDDSALHMGLESTAGPRYAQLFNEVAAAAFICGSSRIAVLGLADE